MAQIRIEQVGKTYGKTSVVHSIDLEIASGDFLVILGPSGCGKSTLLRMIAGLEEISDGTIAIDGTVVNKLEPRERGCAMVFQNYALYPHMTVAENIGYALKVSGMRKAERAEKVSEVARMLELEPMLARKPAELSGGQRQRVAMGRAMIREPKVFLFDEPLSNLDAKLRVQMRAEIRRLHRRLKATSVFVTHDQVEAMTLADRMVVMNGGRIEQYGTPSEIYDRPATRFVASFVGSPSMNLFEGRTNGQGVTILGGLHLPVRPVGLKEGEVVTVGIRPEDIRLGKSRSDRTVATGVVDFVEELGAGRVIYADIGGTAMAAMTAERGHPATGMELGFSFPVEALHFYDFESGLRLETAAVQSGLSMVHSAG